MIRKIAIAQIAVAQIALAGTLGASLASADPVIRTTADFADFVGVNTRPAQPGRRSRHRPAQDPRHPPRAHRR